MKRNFVVSFFALLLFGLSLFIFDSNEVEAATIGQQLPQPEEGWKRYDDTHPAIKYSNSFYKEYLVSHYGGNIAYTKGHAGSFEFKFQGTKLRLFSFGNNTKGYRPEVVNISIDGVVEQYTERYTPKNTVMVYEKDSLENEIHTVKVWVDSLLPTEYFGLDAIDIDSEGYLIPLDIESPILNGELKGEGHALTWNSIEGAVGYNVKRSLNAGGPYEIIAGNVTTNSYLDKDIEKGKKYYYVVSTVVKGAESENSNEVTIPIIENSNATLVLHLVNNQIKEYNLTSSELNNFLNWSASGSESFYVFTQQSPEPSYNSIEDYIIKDKIVWLQVKKY